MLCNEEYRHKKASKALWYLAGVAKNIKICKKVSVKQHQIYKAIHEFKMWNKGAKKCVLDDIVVEISNMQENAEVLESKRQQSGKIVEKSKVEKPKTDVNERLMQHNTASASSILTAKIANFIHAHGLSFGIAKKPRFQAILKAAKNVKLEYVPPDANMVRGELLERNFESYQAKQMEQLKKDQDVFGLALYGDCATIKRMPLMNILASSINNPTILLEVVNATDQLEDGGKKDASWISSHFHPHLERIDPHGSIIDCFFFDGDSNLVVDANALQVTSG